MSCTHFQCSAGAFSYLSDHFSHNFSVDMSHQILNLNINLMLVVHTCTRTCAHAVPFNLFVCVCQGQAQECLLEKSMLDNRKSFLVARISAQVGAPPGQSFQYYDIVAHVQACKAHTQCDAPPSRWWITTRRPAGLWRTPRRPPCWGRSRKTGKSWCR